MSQVLSIKNLKESSFNHRAWWLVLVLCLHALTAIDLRAATSPRVASTSSLTQRERPAKRITKHKKQRPASQPKARRADVIYYPTPPEAVAEMLKMANIKATDVLYDLGSGDGRIPIAAAKQFGIRAVGIEINPDLVSKARENARQAGVSDRVRFMSADLFRTNFSDATVVTLYLSRSLNLLLRPRLLRELRPGTRILSHDFDMGDWQPEQSVKVPWRNLYRTVYLWTVPEAGKIKRTK
ncbi:MAG: methyltransferase domain-containing protein [Pyrinomonadaceae bacterium MAG19_C2-C3]|nr:methyltransferase domain-containing protein [Pyrinomonadaceae bacterium MAG19_C2-C3]